jgi:hypothetical protein
MNATTRVSKENLEHITGLKKGVPMFGSLRDFTRGGQRERHISSDNNKRDGVYDQYELSSFLYV